MVFWTCQRPLFGASLERVPPGGLIFFSYFFIFFTTLEKFHDTFIHVLQSDHSLCFSLITLNKHLIFFKIFAHFLDPLPETPVWGPLERVPRGVHLSLLLNKFHDTLIHVLQSDHSLCFSLIVLNKHLIFSQFFAHFGPLPETPVWGPLWRGF
jgi:hypothetical protein